MYSQRRVAGGSTDLPGALTMHPPLPEDSVRTDAGGASAAPGSARSTASDGSGSEPARIEIRSASGSELVVEAPAAEIAILFEKALALFVDGGPVGLRKMAATRPLENDPVELVRSSLARTASQRCLVLALWLEEIEGRRRWMPSELADPLAQLPFPPKNVSDLLAKAKRRGELLHEDEGWCLSEEGRRMVRVDLLPLSSLSGKRAAGA